MDEEKLKRSNEILKGILGEEKLRELLEVTINILDIKLGKEHSGDDEVIIANVINKFIVHIGYSLAEGKSIEDFEKMCNPVYRFFIHFNSINELYEIYKEYIEIVKNYYINDKK